MALREIHCRTTEKFQCEKDVGLRKHLQVNFPCDLLIRDAAAKAFTEHAPRVDVFTAGFPCQPYSVAGAHRGELDSRAAVIDHIIAYIRRARPAVWLLGNVPGLASQHRDHFKQVLRRLCKDASREKQYVVKWKLLDTSEHGVPHRRRRIYIVGILKSRLAHPFRFPRRFRSAPPLASILCNRAARRCTLRKTAKHARKQVATLYKTLRQRKQRLSLQHEVAADIDSSTLHYRVDMLPCLTAAMG